MKKGVLALFILSIVACGSEESIPDYVIPAERMSEILYDTQLIEAALLKKIIKGKGYADMQATAMVAYGEVYKKYGVSKGRFDSSWTYYLAHPEQLEPVYDTLVDRLERAQKQMPAPNVSK